MCAALAIALSVAFVATSKVTYESRSTVLLLPLPGEVAPGGGRERTLDVETQATVARSTVLLEAVGQRLGLTAPQVKAASRVLAAPTGDVLFIYFVDKNAEFAADGALVYTEEYLSQRKATADNAAKRQKALLETQVAALQSKIEDLTTLIDIQVELGEEGRDRVAWSCSHDRTSRFATLPMPKPRSPRSTTIWWPAKWCVDPRTAVNRTGMRVRVHRRRRPGGRPAGRRHRRAPARSP